MWHNTFLSSIQPLVYSPMPLPGSMCHGIDKYKKVFFVLIWHPCLSCFLYKSILLSFIIFIWYSIISCKRTISLWNLYYPCSFSLFHFSFMAYYSLLSCNMMKTYEIQKQKDIWWYIFAKCFFLNHTCHSTKCCMLCAYPCCLIVLELILMH